MVLISKRVSCFDLVLNRFKRLSDIYLQQLFLINGGVLINKEEVIDDARFIR